MGGLWGGKSSYHHNLIHTCGSRHPKFAYTYDGDIIFHCMAYTKNPLAISGYSPNIIDRSFLIENEKFPKCKKCLKEEIRINLITNRST